MLLFKIFHIDWYPFHIDWYNISAQWCELKTEAQATRTVSAVSSPVLLSHSFLPPHLSLFLLSCSIVAVLSAAPLPPHAPLPPTPLLSLFYHCRAVRTERCWWPVIMRAEGLQWHHSLLGWTNEPFTDSAHIRLGLVCVAQNRVYNLALQVPALPYCMFQMLSDVK